MTAYIFLLKSLKKKKRITSVLSEMHLGTSNQLSRRNYIWLLYAHIVRLGKQPVFSFFFFFINVFVSRPFAEERYRRKSQSHSTLKTTSDTKKDGRWEEILLRPNWDDRDVNGGDDQRITVKVMGVNYGF